jgi:hypothetical protein
MNSKKAQGLSLQMIVIAVIVLVILAVIIVIFAQRMGSFGDNVDSKQNSLCRSTIGRTCAESCSALGRENMNPQGPPKIYSIVQGNKGQWIDCKNTEECCQIH